MENTAEKSALSDVNLAVFAQFAQKPSTETRFVWLRSKSVEITTEQLKTTKKALTKDLLFGALSCH